MSHLPDLEAHLADLPRSRERLAAFSADTWARDEAMPSDEENTRFLHRGVDRLQARGTWHRHCPAFPPAARLPALQCALRADACGQVRLPAGLLHGMRLQGRQELWQELAQDR
ncbi:hypothetical protein JIX56_03270 [Streptomyces sp. CA-210063]|uniref:hypothetical protein n=1 Tax=Streptomyces sp. CA-210063 TaxID=2801029 RepID=UPI00214CA285|nr:hypothetical protein [Streptomyces sp. CA-210063]UUU28999.1 hypothetical protein JIX56_03270 [Streptomyces sp. CA-210063]